VFANGDSLGWEAPAVSPSLGIGKLFWTKTPYAVIIEPLAAAGKLAGFRRQFVLAASYAVRHPALTRIILKLQRKNVRRPADGVPSFRPKRDN